MTEHEHEHDDDRFDDDAYYFDEPVRCTECKHVIPSEADQDWADRALCPSCYVEALIDELDFRFDEHGDERAGDAGLVLTWAKAHAIAALMTRGAQRRVKLTRQPRQHR